MSTTSSIQVIESHEVHVLAIAGSLRRRSHNRALLEAAAQLAPEGMTISVYGALGAVPLFNEDVANGSHTPSGVAQLRASLSRCDGLLIATPEYNQAVPGVLKNVIDWLSLSEADQGLEGRPVAVTGVTTGPWGTRLAQTMLRQMLASTQAIVLPQPTLYLRDAESLFDETGRLIDVKTRHRLGEMVAAFDQWIRLLKHPAHRTKSDYADPILATHTLDLAVQ